MSSFNNPEQQELLHFLWERRYKLDDIGITTKNVFDWSKQGLLLDPVKPKGRRKYCIVEFVWLKLIVGLREFGLSLDAIREVRKILLESFTMDEVINLYTDDEHKEAWLQSIGEEKYNEARVEMEFIKNDITEQELLEINQELNLPDQQFLTTVISCLTVEAIYNKRDYNLYIHSDGTCLIGESENYVPLAEEMNFFMKPYIKYSLQLLFSEFLQADNLISNEESIHYRLLSEKEVELIDLLKKDNLVTLTVRFDQNQQIKLIETEENIKVDNARGKITDFLMRNNYQEIVCKTQDGNVTSLRRKTKYK